MWYKLLKKLDLEHKININPLQSMWLMEQLFKISSHKLFFLIFTKFLYFLFPYCTKWGENNKTLLPSEAVEPLTKKYYHKLKF